MVASRFVATLQGIFFFQARNLKAKDINGKSGEYTESVLSSTIYTNLPKAMENIIFLP